MSTRVTRSQRATRDQGNSLSLGTSTSAAALAALTQAQRRKHAPTVQELTSHVTLHGKHPEEWELLEDCRFTSLERLSLEAARFAVGGMTRPWFPSQFFGCRLRFLELVIATGIQVDARELGLLAGPMKGLYELSFTAGAYSSPPPQIIHECLGRCENLTKLEMKGEWWTGQVTNQTLSVLARLPQLKHLTLEPELGLELVQQSEGLLRTVEHPFPCLTELGIMTEALAVDLLRPYFSSITHLTIDLADDNASALQKLARWTTLQSLSVSLSFRPGVKISGSDLEALGQLTKLESLSIHPISAVAPPHLEMPAWTDLRYVRFFLETPQLQRLELQQHYDGSPVTYDINPAVWRGEGDWPARLCFGSSAGCIWRRSSSCPISTSMTDNTEQSREPGCDSWNDRIAAYLEAMAFIKDGKRKNRSTGSDWLELSGAKAAPKIASTKDGGRALSMFTRSWLFRWFSDLLGHLMQLPEMISNILQWLAEDQATLFNALLVNRYWAAVSKQILWRNPTMGALARLPPPQRIRCAQKVERLVCDDEDHKLVGQWYEELRGLEFPRLRTLALTSPFEERYDAENAWYEPQFFQQSLQSLAWESTIRGPKLDPRVLQLVADKCPRLLELSLDYKSMHTVRRGTDGVECLLACLRACQSLRRIFFSGYCLQSWLTAQSWAHLANLENLEYLTIDDLDASPPPGLADHLAQVRRPFPRLAKLSMRASTDVVAQVAPFLGSLSLLDITLSGLGLASFFFQSLAHLSSLRFLRITFPPQSSVSDSDLDVLSLLTKLEVASFRLSAGPLNLPTWTDDQVAEFLLAHPTLDILALRGIMDDESIIHLLDPYSRRQRDTRHYTRINAEHITKGGVWKRIRSQRQ